MSENVFNVIGLGRQAGDFAAPGSAVPASVLYPVAGAVNPDLALGGAYPPLDRGRNVRNMGGSGYKGVRGASATFPSEVRFEDVMHILEMIYAGGVTPTGSAPYVWVYPFETGAPSVVPYTIETGNIDDAAAQQRLVSALAASLTLGFSAITVGQASPWTLSADILAFDREQNALTPDLPPMASQLETVQGHLTRLYEGSIDTAFDDLPELAASLRSFTMTPTRNLTRRAYGGTTDTASKFGYTDLATATYEMVVAVSSDSKTDLHDVWNTAGGTLGEKRIRILAEGSGDKYLQIDARAGMFAIPFDDSDGERVYKITGEFADDETLDASHVIEIGNDIPSLEPYY